MAALTYTLVALAAFLAGLYGPMLRLVVTEALDRPVNPAGLLPVENMVQCEGLHQHVESNLLFAVCKDVVEGGAGWLAGQGRSQGQDFIHIIDPALSTTKKLVFTNFDGPFSAHDFDIVKDPMSSDAVYIHAVNDATSTTHLKNQFNAQQSQVEVFHYIFGSSNLRHVRSVRHPLVRTSNHLVATSPTSFFITTNHGDSESKVLRATKGLGKHELKWSNIVHVEIGDLEAAASPSASVTANIAFTGLQNHNRVLRTEKDDELDYPLEWMRGSNVPCVLSAQNSV